MHCLLIENDICKQSDGEELYNQTNEKTKTNLTNILQAYTTETNLYNIAKFDIRTFIDDSQTQLKGNFNYAVSLYTEETIKRFVETYTEILKQLATLVNNSQRQENIKIADLKYLSIEQYNQITNSHSQPSPLHSITACN